MRQARLKAALLILSFQEEIIKYTWSFVMQHIEWGDFVAQAFLDIHTRQP